MGWVTDWLTSIGTVGSASAAVYLGVVEPRRRRPQLSTDKPELVMAQTTVDAGPDFLSAWLRVPVRNDLKRDAAEDVEVFLNSVRSGPSAEQLEDRELAGFALAWTAVDGTKVLISPGATRHINVGFVIPVVPGFTEPRFQLAVSGGLPRGGRAVWSLPVAEIELVVSARNASAMLVRFGVTLAPDGDVTAEVLG